MVPIRLPPLRERAEDIPDLVDHFVTKYRERHGLPTLDLAKDDLERLGAHAWPGNVRELENFVEHALIMGAFDFGRWGPVAARPKKSSGPAAESVAVDGPVQTMRSAVDAAERDAVVNALRHADGNKAAAARLLGVSYKTLFNKINEHGIREAVKID